jgi:uncharacterized membrane protein (UPF0127 family)
MPTRRVAALAAALLLATPALAVTGLGTTPCPNVGLPTQTATFVTAKGKFKYKLDIAATGEQQQCGLMYREKMPKNAGMVFPFDPPRQATFWMDNTPLPLDLIFVGPDNRVLNVLPGKPFSRDLIPSAGVTASVIELNLGEAARIGLKPGDKVIR